MPYGSGVPAEALQAQAAIEVAIVLVRLQGEAAIEVGAGVAVGALPKLGEAAVEVAAGCVRRGTGRRRRRLGQHQCNQQGANHRQARRTERFDGGRGRAALRVGLAARISHWPAQLSGGERQRVAVVRALINRPQLLLADEPTGSLDQVAARQLGQLLVELNREEGVSLIVVTHAWELAQRMGRVLQLRNGSLTPLNHAAATPAA